jgi:ketosteroid isomerase-like protein
MRIIDPATRQAAVELQQLVADYWRDVDADHSRTAPEYFTEDCIFEVTPTAIFHGREGVREFYDGRARRGDRTARHNVMNLRVRLEGPDSAVVNYTIALCGADGTPPIVDYLGPSAISDVESVCVRDGDGRWRFASTRGKLIFVGREPYTRSMAPVAPS